MVKSKAILSTEPPRKNVKKKPEGADGRFKRLMTMGKISSNIINELYSPIDSINRFINLALQAMGDNSQGREFLLESKEGIRKTSQLLKKLNNYAKKIEKEFQEITTENG